MNWHLTSIGKGRVRVRQQGYVPEEFNAAELEDAIWQAAYRRDNTRHQALLAAKKFLEANTGSPVLAGYRKNW